MSALPLICDKYSSGRRFCILSHHTHLRPKRRPNSHNKTNNKFLYSQSTPASFQTCPKAVPNAMIIIAPNALTAIADGSTDPSVIVLPTLRCAQNTACLTRHTSLAPNVLVKKRLSKEHSETKRLVTTPLAATKIRKVKTGKAKARKVKAKTRSKSLLYLLSKHNRLYLAGQVRLLYEWDC
jgi:hypothetical protein